MFPPSRFPDSATLPRPKITLHDQEAPGAIEPAPKRALLSWTVKLSLVVALFGFGASQYMTWLVGAASVQREARLAGGLGDPDTTGSIAAADARLDPCAVPLRLKGGR